MLLRAKHVVPIEARPIKNGAVLIEGTRIGAVGPAGTRGLESAGFGSAVIDFGDAVMLPGFVNGHTHLELTHLAGKVAPKDDFFGWLEQLVSVTRSASDRDRALAAAARDGMRQSLGHGATTVGDVTSLPSGVRAELRHGPLRVVSFGEVIAVGTIRDRLSDRLQSAVDGGCASDHLTIGVSPHAPYTIEPDGVRACVEVAARLDMPMCMHLAETRAEARYTEHGDGPCRDYLERLRIWDDLIRCPRMPPVPLAHTCGLLTRRTVLAHCNYVSESDAALLAGSGAHVAYCPRTHAAFAHEPHPFRAMLEAGVNVCIGTDSLASNPSLSVLDEIRHLRRLYDDIDGHTLLEMATLRGARALGLAAVTGSLSPGKSADVTVVPLSPGGPPNPIENLLVSTLQPIATLVRGRRVRA